MLNNTFTAAEVIEAMALVGSCAARLSTQEVYQIREDQRTAIHGKQHYSLYEVGGNSRVFYLSGVDLEAFRARVAKRTEVLA